MNKKIPPLERLLCRLVNAGDFEGTKDLLEAGVDVKCLCSAALNPPCLHGRKDLIHLLLNHGADPYDCFSPLCLVHDPWWGPAIRWAAYRDMEDRRFDLLPLLLSSKPNPPPDALKSALETVAWESRDEGFSEWVGHQLIDLGVKLHGPDLILNGIHWRWVRYLIRNKHANPEPRIGYYRGNALEEAVEYLDVRRVRALLDNGADPNGVPMDHLYLVDPDNAQVPENAWAILRLLANASGSKWRIPAESLAELL